MPDHIEDSFDWTTLYHQQNPDEDKAWKRWMRKPTVSEITITVFLLRSLQLVLEGLLCGLAIWLILLVKPESIPVYFWAAIWPGLAFLIVLLYLLPTTFKHAKAKKRTMIPFIIEAIAVILWIVTWSVMRNDQMYRQCVSERQCAVRIAYLVLGMVELLLFTFLGYWYSIGLMFQTTSIQQVHREQDYGQLNPEVGIVSSNQGEEEGEQALHPQASHSFNTNGTANIQSSSADTKN